MNLNFLSEDFHSAGLQRISFITSRVIMSPRVAVSSSFQQNGQRPCWKKQVSFARLACLYVLMCVVVLQTENLEGKNRSRPWVNRNSFSQGKKHLCSLGLQIMNLNFLSEDFHSAGLQRVSSITSRVKMSPRVAVFSSFQRHGQFFQPEVFRATNFTQTPKKNKNEVWNCHLAMLGRVAKPIFTSLCPGQPSRLWVCWGSKGGTAWEPLAISRPSLSGPQPRDVDALACAKEL